MNGFDGGTRETNVGELSPEPSHVDVDGAGLDCIFAPPEGRNEFLPTQKTARAGRERGQERELLRGDGQSLPGYVDLVALAVDLKRAREKTRGLGRRQHALSPRRSTFGRRQSPITFRSSTKRARRPALPPSPPLGHAPAL